MIQEAQVLLQPLNPKDMLRISTSLCKPHLAGPESVEWRQVDHILSWLVPRFLLFPSKAALLDQ